MPNEDTAFSRRVSRSYRTGYRRRVLAETDARRVSELGLTGTALYYARLDAARIRATY